MELQEAINRCKAACEAKAVAMGFSVQAGRDVFVGSITSDIERWSLENFLLWVLSMEALYGKMSHTGQKLLELYKECQEIIVLYGEIAKDS